VIAHIVVSELAILLTKDQSQVLGPLVQLNLAAISGREVHDREDCMQHHQQQDVSLH
jgi:hypothetical protein